MTDKMTIADIPTILEVFEAAGVFEDRMEYAIEDLMRACDLDRDTATALQAALHDGDTHYRPF